MLPCCCPICKREYAQAPKICECGFEGIYYPVQNSDEQRHLESAELFAIYKYAKRVLLGELEYRPAELFVNDLDEYTLIDGMSGDAGLALIDPAAVGIEGESVAGDGLLAFKTDTKALILNTHRANGLFLDESCVKVLILGVDMKSFRHGYFMPYSGLRYIYVHKDNPAFCAENNVLFDKRMTRLICYASMRPESEYKVPGTVRALGPYSFYYPRHLRRLYLPKGIKIEDRALRFDPQDAPEIIYF